MHSQNTVVADVELEADALLGEGPVWDEIEGKLYWVDILSGTLFLYNPRTKTNATFDVGGHLGAIALRENGGLVVAKETGFAFFANGREKAPSVADPEAHIPTNRFNDGKCDPGGRFWAGTMAYDVEEGAGSLYCLNPDLSVDVKLTGTTISNGLAWNQERSRFYFVDSGTGAVYSFDYDEITGEISNRLVVRRFVEQEGTPDGMTIDTDDHLWVALYAGGKVIRINPADGKTVFEVRLPVPNPTSCTFGGSTFDDLYITTARENMSEEDIAEAPLSGSLFKVRVPFSGYPVVRFSG